MFEAFFSDPDLIYRINVINSIDFYSLGFEMVRGETKAENMLQWLRKGEVADVLVTNVQCPDMSGFELAETVRKYCPRVRVIFLADTPNCVIAQQVVRFGAYDFLLKSDGIDALRAALSRAAEELCAERRENAYLRSQTNWDEIIPKLLRLLTALRPEICEEHWQLYSRIKPLVSNDSFCIETLLVRALMEELRSVAARWPPAEKPMMPRRSIPRSMQSFLASRMARCASDGCAGALLGATRYSSTKAVIPMVFSHAPTSFPS